MTIAGLVLSCAFINRKQTDMTDSQLLSIRGTNILDDLGRPVTLKGCNLGNWLVLEMWMLDYRQSGIGDQYRFEGVLTDRFGIDETDRLMEVYRENWITERDFQQVASFDMNTIRLPFEYRLLMDDDKPFELKENAWHWLDLAVDLAKKHNLYVILDMHGAPGRQSGMDHTGRSGYNQLWVDKQSQELTVWLWTEISNHYRQNPVIASYDILNEPWGGSEIELKELITRCYHTIRNNSDDHIVIFPGHYSGIDFYEDEKSISYSNVLYTMHFYPGFFGWGAPVPQVHADFLSNGLVDWKERMTKLDAPLLIGEFNVVSKRGGGGEMMRRYFDRYKENGWPATMWSYKVLTQQGNIGEMNWGMVTNAEPLNKLDLLTDSLSNIEKWFINLNQMDYTVDSDLKHWLTTTDQPSTLDDLAPLPPPIVEAPGLDDLPVGWTATDIGESLDGGQLVDEAGFTVYGGGADIWTDTDQFRFIWTEVTGDFTITTTIRELLNTNSYAKAGLMARVSLDQHSAHALINVFPFGNTEFGSRNDIDAMMQAISGPFLEMGSANLKLNREGNTITGSVFINDEWEKVGQVEFDSLNTQLYVGIATLSHDNSRLTRAVYNNLKLINE